MAVITPSIVNQQMMAILPAILADRIAAADATTAALFRVMARAVRPVPAAASLVRPAHLAAVLRRRVQVVLPVAVHPIAALDTKMSKYISGDDEI